MKDTLANPVPVTDAFKRAAGYLEDAAAELRDESTWIEQNFPLSTWTDDLAGRYLDSSKASREYTIRQRAASALAEIGADAELVKAVRRGSIR